MTATVRLPRGWATGTLDDIALIIRGVTFPASAKLSQPTSSSVVCLRTSNVQRTLKYEDVLHIDESFIKRDEQWLRDGDSVISMANSYELVGKVAYAKNPPSRTTIGGFIAIVRPLGTDHRFLHYQLVTTHIQQAMRRTASQTVNISNLSLRGIRPIELVLAPLAEQHRIVEAIESYLTRLDNAVSLLERVQQNLKRYRASVLKAGVEGRLVPTEAELAKKEGRTYEPASELLQRILIERRKKWIENAAEKARAKAEKKAREAGKPWTHADDVKTLEKERGKAAKKYKEPAAPDITDLPDLPKGWCWASLEQLSYITGGITKNSKRLALPLQVPYLRVANVYADKLRLNEIKKIGVTEDEYSRTVLQTNDLLVVEGNGSIGQIGRVALWNGSIKGCCHQNHLIKARLIVQELARWALMWLLSTAGRAQIMHVASSTSGLHTLNITKVSALPIPLPPQAEARRLIHEIDRVHSLVNASAGLLKNSAARSSRLRQSILKWAFEGKLVPQDPNDLPAPRPGKYFVYALECDDGSIYIGQTHDILERWKQHASGRGAEWTKRHVPKKLVHWEEFDSIDAAVKRERDLKTGFGRKWLKREMAAGRTRQAGEPASVLLERIKAERESIQQPKRRRTNKKKDEQRKHDEQLDLLGGSDK